jgi:peptidoglycan hydrolase CwlO-like protein
MFDKTHQKIKKLQRNVTTIENEIDDMNHKIERFDSDVESDLERIKADLEDDLMSAHMSMEELNEELVILRNPFRYYFQTLLNRFNVKLDKFNSTIDNFLHGGSK